MRKFFPERGPSRATEVAKAVCATCPEREPCRRFALSTPELGRIWAGTTYRFWGLHEIP